MSKVFLLDTNKQPLNPIHPAQARQLLRNKKAAVFRQFPFALILKESRSDSLVSPLRLKIDPGAKFTGLALVNDSTGDIVFAAELKHRGFAIRSESVKNKLGLQTSGSDQDTQGIGNKRPSLFQDNIRDALTSRRQLRRGRRARKTRYRKPRFLNRTRPDGWLAPSLQSRVDNIKTWVERLRKLAPIKAISQELVRFDMQLMRNPDIEGKEYQQGTLTGYETREYLLEKWGRQCAYCGIKDVPFQIEHIHPRVKVGSNSITNLTLSCEKCNTKKGTKDIKEFLKKDSTRLEKILKQAKRPLADAAAVNTTRFALLSVLKATGLPIETGSGGLTKFNRSQQKLEKTHWIDAACVGKSTPNLNIKGIKPLLVTANGHGSRQMCGTDKFGFPSRHRTNKQIHFGFQTGDIIKSVVTSGKKVGKYVGRVLCRATGNFDIATKKGRVSGISHKYCLAIQKKDGYSYSF